MLAAVFLCGHVHVLEHAASHETPKPLKSAPNPTMAYRGAVHGAAACHHWVWGRAILKAQVFARYFRGALFGHDKKDKLEYCVRAAQFEGYHYAMPTHDSRPSTLPDLENRPALI
jgi:hypothetical protein